MCAVFLLGCDDADDEQQEPRRVEIASRPAPNPEKESLSINPKGGIRETDFTQGPRFELFSQYSGQDIRQVTGVSGRTLWLCFTAPWCPHSRRMVQELRTMAREEKGRVQIVELNADDYPAIAEEFGITKVPTTVLYTEGVKLRTIEGAFNAESLRRYLHRVLSRDDDGSPETTLSPTTSST